MSALDFAAAQPLPDALRAQRPLLARALASAAPGDVLVLLGPPLDGLTDAFHFDAWAEVLAPSASGWAAAALPGAAVESVLASSPVFAAISRGLATFADAPGAGWTPVVALWAERDAAGDALCRAVFGARAVAPLPASPRGVA